MENVKKRRRDIHTRSNEKKKIKIKLSLTKMENSLVDVIAPVFFFLSFRLSPGFENVYVRPFATAL